MATEVLATFVLILGASLAVNPGLKIRITQNGLSYAATQAIRSLHLQGEKIPDIHGEDHVAVGKVKYDITRTTVTSFVAPASQLSIRSGSGIHWSVTGCNAQLQGDWHYEYKLGFIKIKDSGTFTLSVTNAGIQLDFILGKDGAGRPTISATGCSASVGGVRVHLHGGASWLYSIFDHQIDKAFQKQLIKILCDQARKAINVDANQALAKLKVVLPIRGTGTLDYSMLVPPIFATGYVDSLHKGEIYYRDHQEAPYTPAPFPESTDRSKMAYIWVSEYLMNTAGWALQKQHVLKYFFSPDDLKPDERHLMNTTCPNNVCIGNFISALQTDFPGCTVSINMSTSQAPTLQVTPRDIVGHMEGDLVFFINFPNKTTKYIFSTHATANISLTLGMRGQTITGKVTNITPNITVTDSRIGGVSGAGLTWTFKNVLAPHLILPLLNKIGDEGLDLPGTKQISYVNPTIKFVQNAIVLSTDLKWTPDFEEDERQDRHPNGILLQGSPSKRLRWNNSKHMQLL